MVYKSSTIASASSGSGGSGIQSINSDTTAAQIITNGVGISIATSNGTTTITNTSAGSAGVSSVFGRTGVVTAQWNDYQFNLIGGVASVSQGGTGVQTLSAHGVLLGEGTANVSAATTGIAARLLIDQGSADPAFKVVTGDVSVISTGVHTVLSVNSVAYPASPGTNTVPVVTSSNQITYETVPNAALANSAITVGAQTGLAGGGSVALGSAITLSMGTNTANTLAGYNNSGVFSDVSIGSNLSLSGGSLSANPGGSNTQVQYNNNTLFAGVINATSDGSNLFVVTQSASDNSTKAASTAYVTSAINTAIAGVNPAVAVYAASTASGDTGSLTYNNGVSGIGATFTGTNNTALTFDGQTLTSLNQRILVKNDQQSANPGAYNGVYYLTQLQGVALPPILTRALDYDMPSDINNTGAIPVINGTVNAQTSWVLTSTVNTVGTDPLSFTKFTLAPSTIITTSTTAGGGLTGTYPNPALANPSATSLGGVQSISAITHNFMIGISTSGIPSLSQPYTSDLSDISTFSLNTSGSITTSNSPGSNASAVTLSGTVHTGGTGTTNFPHFFIQPSNASAATTWDTNGTFFGINTAATFLGKVIDIKANGSSTSAMTLTSGGVMTTNGGITAQGTVQGTSVVGTNSVNTNSGGQIGWSTRSLMLSPADGIIELVNNAQTGFTRLDFGGTTSSFPAIKRNSAALNFRLADDSADATVTFTTQSVGDSSTNGATTAFVASAITNLNASNLTSGTIPTARLPTNQTLRQVNFSLDGQGSAIAPISGSNTWYLADNNFAGTINSWSLVADKSGSIDIDIWKANASVPTSGNSITASAQCSLASSQSVFSGPITGWSSAVSPGDCWGFNLVSASTLTKANLTINITAS